MTRVIAGGCPKKYPFDRMAVGDHMEFRTPQDADRAVSAGNSHACRPDAQGRRYSRRKVSPWLYTVTRKA